MQDSPGFVSYDLLADAVLAVHVGIVAFVVLGFLLILLGNLRRWRWVNQWWLRLSHLGGIAVVVAESWFGIVCPLTTLEVWLRVQSGTPAYADSFMGHWLQRMLYFDAPAWVFTVVYSLFGAAVLAVWLVFPPSRGGRQAKG